MNKQVEIPAELPLVVRLLLQHGLLEKENLEEVQKVLGQQNQPVEEALVSAELASETVALPGLTTCVMLTGAAGLKLALPP